MFKIQVKGECYIKSNTGTEEKEFEIQMDVDLPLYRVIRDERSNRERVEPLFGRVLSHIRDQKSDLLTKALRKELGAGVRLAHKSELVGIEWHGDVKDIEKYRYIALEKIKDHFDKFKYSQAGELTLVQLDEKRALEAKIDMQVEHLNSLLPEKKVTKKTSTNTNKE